ncbi:MAG TPA: S8 family serine peptidase, partial [Candidatus Eisenbacteria bacterium]|nr:S8 family serine peptidase [Candidatus Eisenbacteria bacterium]
ALLQEDDAAAAILYAADRGAHVLNLSFGDVVDAPLIRHAVRYARERGVLVVASAGNTGRDHPFFPAAYPGVLVPGASTRDDTRAGFSTYGQDLDLLAPGSGVYTTDLHGTYRTATGTSFSAPMTAGVAALAWSAHPAWTADQVAWVLRHTARRTQNGWSPETGWGLLDAASAVLASETFVVQIDSHPPDGVEPGVRGTIVATDLMEWSLSAMPESSAVTGSGAGERVIVDGSTLQVQHDSLGAFTPPAGDEGFWVFRLRARLRDQGWIEERSRAFLPAPDVHAEELSVEVQAGSTGWGLAAWWASPERQQGAVRLTGPDVVERFAIEPTLGRRHGVRLVDPLSPGERTLHVLGRSGETLPFGVLSEVGVTVPSLVVDFTVQEGEVFPAGTPMPRVLEMGSVSEIFVEAPPGPDAYGIVTQYELSSLGTAVARGSSESIYRGIPVDAQDSDQDDKLELVIFRLDAWEIWEASDSSGFPNLLVHEEAGTRPMQFVDAGLLVAAGASLRLMRPDGSGGFVLASEAASGGTDLQT